MPPREGHMERKLTRRRFIGAACGLLAAGVISVGLGEILFSVPRREAEKGDENASLRPRGATAGRQVAASQPALIEGAAVQESPHCYPDPIGRLEQQPTTFSIFWITDTQFLSETNPSLYAEMTNWIVKNWRAHNGKLVVHTGDLVQNGSKESEWENVDAAMSVLLQNGIPYTWCAGNHDDLSNGNPTSGWIGLQSAPALDPEVVSGQVNALEYASWAGDYHDGMNTAVSFRANGLDFLVVNLEWKPQPDVLEWAESLLDNPRYAGHHVIVAPHAYIDEFGSLHNRKWAPQLGSFIGGLTSLLNSHSSSVFLTLNGHFATDCGYNTPSMINGRNELMFDRQDSTDEPGEATGRGADDDTAPDSARVGGSTVTILTFAPAQNVISAKTFDVHKGEWREGPTENYSVKMFATSST